MTMAIMITRTMAEHYDGMERSLRSTDQGYIYDVVEVRVWIRLSRDEHRNCD